MTQAAPKADHIGDARNHLLTKGWFSELGDPNTLGRFEDVETTHKGPPNYVEVRRTVTVLKTRVVSLAHIWDATAEIGTTRVKPNNKTELCERFPGAWEAYEAAKTAPPVEAKPVGKKRTPIEAATFLSGEQLATLKAHGFATVEEIAGCPPAQQREVLGPRAYDLVEQASIFLGRKKAKPATVTTIEQLDFIPPMARERMLWEMNIWTLDRVAEMTDAECWKIGHGATDWRKRAQGLVAQRDAPPAAASRRAGKPRAQQANR